MKISIAILFAVTIAHAQDGYNSTNATLKRQDDRLESERYYRNKAPNSSSKPAQKILPASSNDWSDGRYEREEANRIYRENEKQKMYDMNLKSYKRLSADVPKNSQNYDRLYNLAIEAGFKHYEATELLEPYKSAPVYQPAEVYKPVVDNTPRYVSKTFLSNAKYEGMSQYGKMNGYGVYTWEDGSKYEGYWLNDKMNGQGKITKLNGFFKNGLFQSNNGVSFIYYDPKNNEISYEDYEANRPKQIVVNKAVAEKVIPKIENIKQACEDFFIKNKNKRNVITTATGLQYLVLQEGTGPKAKKDDLVNITYRGTSINEIEFDNTKNYGGNIDVKPEQLIPGMEEALLTMSKNSFYKLFIPANLAYGKKGFSDKIRPDEGVIYIIGLLEIK